MSPLPKPRSSSARRVANYRRRKRAAGLVPKTIWVPDVTDPAFLAEYDRQCRAVAASEDARDVQDFMDALYAELDLGPIPAYRLPPEK